MGRVRSPKRRVRDDDFVFGLCSDIVGYRRISSNRLSIGGSTSGSFRSNLELQDFVAGAVFGEVGGWLRIGNDVSYVTQWWHSFYVAGAVFGEVGGWLFVAGAALRDILGDSRSAKCCILQYKIVSKMGRVRSPKRRVRDDDFVFGCGRIILGLSSNYPRIVFLLAEAFRELALKSGAFRFRGRRTIWWGCRVTSLSPRIGNEVSYVTQIIDDVHFAWQAQYLVMLEGDFTFSAHWKWSFICHADHWWRSFCVAGAVFGDVGGWLYLLRALEMTFHMSRRSSMTFILRGRRSIWWGWRVPLLPPRIGNDLSYVTQITDDIDFAWQAQYLVKLDADSCCAAHCKWRFKVVPE